MKVCVFVAGSAVIMLNCVMYFAEPVFSRIANVQYTAFY